MAFFAVSTFVVPEKYPTPPNRSEKTFSANARCRSVTNGVFGLKMEIKLLWNDLIVLSRSVVRPAAKEELV